MATVVYDDSGQLLGYRRTIAAIYADVVALTGPQKKAVWDDLTAGMPRKYLTSDGTNAGAIVALDWAVQDSGAAAAAIASAQQRIMSMYVQDKPKYLDGVEMGGQVINVRGYDPIT